MMDSLLPIMNERKEFVFMAKACEQAELYEEMSKTMVELIKRFSRLEELSVEERNLFSIANKNRIGALRAAWRCLAAGEYAGKENVRRLKENVEAKMVDICTEMMTICNEFLLTPSSSNENKLFFYKMVGDYNRYLAEFMQPNLTFAQNSAAAYESALAIGQQFPPTNPIRLGLALNYSTYYYEIAKDHSKACDLARKAFDDAISQLDRLPEDAYKDATLIMQLLRDNLTLWTSPAEDDEEGG